MKHNFLFFFFVFLASHVVRRRNLMSLFHTFCSIFEILHVVWWNSALSFVFLLERGTESNFVPRCGFEPTTVMFTVKRCPTDPRGIRGHIYIIHIIIQVSRGAGTQSVTIKPTGGGFDPHSRRCNICICLQNFT